MNAMVIDQDPLHLEIGLFTILLIFKFDKSVLQTITCPLISNDFAGQNLSKTAKYKFEILIYYGPLVWLPEK